MLAELRITPMADDDTQKRSVAAVARLLRELPVAYRVHPMGTTLEGDLDAILAAVRRTHRRLREDLDRVLIELTIDDRDAPRGEIEYGLARLADVTGAVPLERTRASDLDRLEAMSERLRAEIQEIRGTFSGTPEGTPTHPAGEASADLGAAEATARSRLALLESVETALARIEDGTYGTCAVCGRPIERARLDAVPYAGRCIACARAREAESA